MKYKLTQIKHFLAHMSPGNTCVETVRLIPNKPLKLPRGTEWFTGFLEKDVVLLAFTISPILDVVFFSWLVDVMNFPKTLVLCDLEKCMNEDDWNRLTTALKKHCPDLEIVVQDSFM